VTVDREFHESFDVREGVRLDLRHGDGDVIVTPWDKDVIDVKVRYYADVTRLGFVDDPDFHVDFDQTGDVVRVVGREAIGSGVVFFQAVREHEYTYTISAPSYVTLEFEGDDGDVSITGWRGDIECSIDDGDVDLADLVNTSTRITTEDGNVSIERAAGEIVVTGADGDVVLTDCSASVARVSVQDGDVTARDCVGDFRVSVDDGDVTLDAITAETVRVSAEDGDIAIDLRGSGAVDLEADADDGDITVWLASELSYAFLITTDDGRVTVDVPTIAGFDQRDHVVSGEVRGREGRVHLSTEDGNVVLRER
jgi:DUF4097 and DUF4098 domain-containing protein YvlB